ELWEKGFRPNVELNQALATDGMSTLLPASRFGICARNQMMRVLPLFARFGRGFGGRIERAFARSHSATLNDLSTLVGLMRTTSSPGTPLRLPYSSACSAPM